jgi:hypothetical protein
LSSCEYDWFGCCSGTIIRCEQLQKKLLKSMHVLSASMKAYEGFQIVR